MDNTTFNIAVLIDGDNAQAKLMKEILEEVSKYGKATIRRIYGDWTIPQMNSWKNIVNEYSINPVQKFNYTVGKNSTDSALIIDAMDILHSGNVEGFCIVSSDSDYTGLAKRIREQGLFVMGIGEKKTPSAFVQSCDIFTYTENLTDDKSDAGHKGNSEAQGKPDELSETDGKTDTTDYLKVIDKAFTISAKDDDEALISTIGANIHKIDPSFDPRTYGFGTLTKLFENIQKYEVVKNLVNGLNYPLVRLK
ncbi:MAG: NYN domain-containing protein [Bacteroidales bacterium]|nr:NYN domain-containing protein [Bacteroidales bacterium]